MPDCSHRQEIGIGAPDHRRALACKRRWFVFFTRFFFLRREFVFRSSAERFIKPEVSDASALLYLSCHSEIRLITLITILFFDVGRMYRL